MISDNSLWNTKPSNYMIEHENHRCSAIYLKCRHRLGPLGKIIYRKDDIRIPPGRVRVTCNKIDTPFRKWIDGNYRLERRRWSAHLSIKNLAVVAFSDRINTIFKQSRPEIASAQYLLGHGKPRHMTTTHYRVTVIENPFDFLMNQATSENGVRPTTIKCISNNLELLGLESYFSTL